jgi:hypothetical protein
MWELHDLGLNAVTRDNMIRYYRAIDIPCMDGIQTSDEVEEEEALATLVASAGILYLK